MTCEIIIQKIFKSNNYEPNWFSLRLIWIELIWKVSKQKHKLVHTVIPLLEGLILTGWLDFLILRLQWFMLLVRSFIIDVRFIISNVLNHECLFRNGTFFKFIRYPNCVFLDAICNLLILAKPAKRLFKNENMNLSYPHVWYSACMLWLRNELLPYMLLENYFCRCISWDIQLQHSKINHLTRLYCIYF